MTRTRPAARLALAVLALAACGSSGGGEPEACGPNGECPTGYSCRASDHRCVKTGGGSADAGAPGVSESAVAPDSHQVDRVSPADGPIATDGHNDAAFDLTVVGPVVGLSLITTDAAGTSQGNQIWDTTVGSAPVPAEIGVSFSRGSQTWQVGVFEDGVLLNQADGSLPRLEGVHRLRLYAADSGYFVPGQHFRLIGHLPDGTLGPGPVFVYPDGAP